MNFNGLAHPQGHTPSSARQVSPGKGALCVARFAEHELAEFGRVRPSSIGGLGSKTLEARMDGFVLARF